MCEGPIGTGLCPRTREIEQSLSVWTRHFYEHKIKTVHIFKSRPIAVARGNKTRWIIKYWQAKAFYRYRKKTGQGESGRNRPVLQIQFALWKGVRGTLAQNKDFLPQTYRMFHETTNPHSRMRWLCSALLQNHVSGSFLAALETCCRGRFHVMWDTPYTLCSDVTKMYATCLSTRKKTGFLKFELNMVEVTHRDTEL